MIITFNDFTMNKAAIFENGIVIIERFDRFLVAKGYKGQYKVFFNTASFNQAIEYGQKL